MTLSVRQTTGATPALRALLDAWDADHAATPPNATGPPATGKDVVLAFRTRPPLDSDVVPESELENLDDDDGPIDTSFLRGVTATGDIMVAHVPATSWKGHSLQHKEFKADICFGPDTTQDDVYAKAIEDCNMIELALNGGLSCVLAYGQTGSGKTHTIGGLEERIAHNLFAKAEVIGARFKQAHGDTSDEPVLSFHVTFLELLGKNAYDLSTPPVDPEDDAEVAARRKVDIMEDKLGDVRPQLKSTLVQSPAELQALITRCLSHRRTTATLKNPRSSRSHAVLTIWVKN
ncbi:P-loop containing nucleoside triphosphate hydrolase protein, partial [Exidia glandulosa HHB12029]